MRTKERQLINRARIKVQFSRTVLLELSSAKDSPEDLAKMQILILEVWVELLRVHISPSFSLSHSG